MEGKNIKNNENNEKEFFKNKGRKH